MIGMDKYGNKFFENLEEELPRELDTQESRSQGLTTGSEDALGRLQGPRVRSVCSVIHNA
jgi:hypothetical protein